MNLYGTSVDEIIHDAPRMPQSLFLKLQGLSVGVLSLISMMYPPTLHSLVRSDFYPMKHPDEDRSIHNVHNMVIRCPTLDMRVL